MARTGFGTMLLAAALVLGSCGREDAGANRVRDSTTSTSTVSPTSRATSWTTDGTDTAPPTARAGQGPDAPVAAASSSTDDQVRAVGAAFHDQWEAWIEIVSEPSITDPLIDDHFTGRAEQAVLDGVSRLLAEGDAFRLPEDPDDFQPRIVDVEIISDVRAVVFECTLDGLVIFDRASGEIVNDDVYDYEKRNTFERVDGRWLVSATTNLEQGDPGCDEL